MMDNEADMKNNIVQFPDPYNYIMDDDSKLCAVAYRGDKGELYFGLEGEILIKGEPNQSIENLRQLMIMWLGLNYPDCLAKSEL